QGEAVKVKISGDGARMTRNSNFILMSFALVESDHDAMAAKGNHTIGVVNGKEDYETLKTCFRDILADIDKLVEEKNIKYFNSPEMKRDLKDLRESAEKKSGNYCCVNPPLLNIELDHIIPDELHLLLRIMDVLTGNLVADAVEWDRSDNWNKKKSERKNTHVIELTETIRACWYFFRHMGEDQC
ncbi:Hypothetical predicted protein, partial [Paramuricea clavata]